VKRGVYPKGSLWRRRRGMADGHVGEVREQGGVKEREVFEVK
jgi:hypothetical protein